MLEKVLVMTFESETEKDLTIKVRDIKDEITSEMVKAVMNYVIEKEVFSINGMPVVKALKAEIVSTEKTMLDLA
ncbi:MAG: DUF2922 domain-containing protein [Clostridium sp.]|uniref:DUF2922 domain-containing protein n=1 Tax=Clostridium sp. TaxID=1506 RepID=UPI003F2EFB32